jgi:hypothetical protein
MREQLDKIGWIYPERDFLLSFLWHHTFLEGSSQQICFIYSFLSGALHTRAQQTPEISESHKSS